MLVTDEKYIYILGGDDCAKCIRTDKKDLNGWENICNLANDDEVSVSEQYGGRLHSGALMILN